MNTIFLNRIVNFLNKKNKNEQSTAKTNKNKPIIKNDDGCTFEYSKYLNDPTYTTEIKNALKRNKKN